MPLLVIHGAKIGCTGCPGALSPLQATAPIGVTATSICLQVASVTDHVPLVNIVPLASCSFRGGNPCVPATPALWQGSCFGPPILGLSPVLTAAHVLNCAQGGLISIADPGQQSIDVGDLVEPEPDEEDDDSGFFEELWDGGWLIADVAMVAADVLTIPSGEAIAGIAARRTARKLAKQTLKAAVKRQRAKRGPKPWPEGPHNQTIQRRIKELEARGHTHKHGGPETEEVVPTPGGAKGSRRPDITTIDANGKVYRENVGRTYKNGKPIKREVEALKDLENATGQTPGYTPYTP